MTVPSPCIKLCVLDADRRTCLGCGRTLDEIAAWASTSDHGRRRVIRTAAARLRVRQDADAAEPGAQARGEESPPCRTRM